MTDERPQRLSEAEFAAAMQRLDELVRTFEELPYPVVREQAMEMLQMIDVVHREALRRLVALMLEQNRVDLIQQAVKDPIINMLLVLYDLVANDDLPEIPTPQNTRNFVPIDDLAPVRRKPNQPVFSEVARVEDVPPGSMKEFPIDNVQVLVANVDGEFYAVRDNCPGSIAPLHLGTLKGPIVICAWHNEAFDVRTGKRADGVQGQGLAVLPVMVSNGIIKLAVNVAPAVTAPR